MKYEQTDSLFRIDVLLKTPPWKESRLVRPLNGETADPTLRISGCRLPDVGWSQGFTHFITEDGDVGWCGINWFEKNAVEIY